jgi:hypothetical protein
MFVANSEVTETKVRIDAVHARKHGDLKVENAVPWENRQEEVEYQTENIASDQEVTGMVVFPFFQCLCDPKVWTVPGLPLNGSMSGRRDLLRSNFKKSNLIVIALRLPLSCLFVSNFRGEFTPFCWFRLMSGSRGGLFTSNLN